MRSFAAMLPILWALLSIPAVLGAQIPVVNGIVGGVSQSPRLKTDAAPVSPAATTPGKLRVTENSGVCETTPGVYQASGYGDLTSSESIWYAPCSSV